MIRLWRTAVWFALVATAVCQSAQPHASSIDQQHTEWIAAALREINTIHIGMNRADLMRVFTTEGGMEFKDSATSHRKYVYRKCPYIKVDMTLEITSPETDLPTDRIKEISRPYLEWTIAD